MTGQEVSSRLSHEMDSTTPSAAAVLDLVPLDDYLRYLLLPRLESINKDSRISLATSALVLQVLILWLTRGHTPGAQILGLSAVTNGRKRRMWIYMIVSSILPALHRLLKQHYQQLLVSVEEEAAAAATSSTISETVPDATFLQQRARQRRLLLLKHVLIILSKALPPLQLGVVLHLWAASSPTTTQQLQHCNVAYAHRRWTFTELLRFLTLVSPVWSLKHVSLILNHFILKPLQRLLPKPAYQQETCTLCHTSPMVVPYQAMPCGHAYCYTCLWPQQTCRQCGTKITNHQCVPNKS